MLRTWRATPIALLVLLCITAACGKKKVAANAPRTPSVAPSKKAPPGPPPKVGDTETGMASWYGHPYHGRPAANGEIYDMDKLTAAHRTLPFNTWVRVENLSNGKTVEVRIIDRGPFVGNRIIDLSRAAAEQIAMIGPGTARVKLTVIRPPATMEAALFAVQAGIFRNKDNADQLVKQMQAKYGTARLVEREGDPVMYRVLVGSETDPVKAEALAARVRGDTSLSSAFVVRLDSH